MSVRDATAASVGGCLDDTELTDDVFAEKAPWYALRILSGAACCPTVGGHVRVASCGREFLVSVKHFDMAQTVARRVRNDYCRGAGVHQAWNLEDVFAMLAESRLAWTQEHALKAKYLRVCFLRSDSQGPGFYRNIQPTEALNTFTDSVRASTSEWLSMRHGQPYDVIIASRVTKPDAVDMLVHLQAAGKIVIYECDDALDVLPEWNPVYAYYTQEAGQAMTFLMQMSDAVFVSTEELKVHLKRPDVTYVCENAINEEMWPCKPRHSDSDRVRILWAGSNTHANDLDMAVPAIKKILESTPNVDFIFMGYIPPTMSGSVYGAEGKVQCVVAPQFKNRVTFVQGVPVTKYPSVVSSLRADIALAPLVDCQFNRCKSALKALEAWAMGIPIIASPVAPYARAINNGVTGLLAGSAGEWHDCIRTLARSTEKREAMGAAGVAELLLRHTVRVKVEVYERALLQIVRHKVMRIDCARAIEERCKEKGW